MLTGPRQSSGLPKHSAEYVCRLPDPWLCSRGGGAALWEGTAYFARPASALEDRASLESASLAVLRAVSPAAADPIGDLVVFHVVENATKTRLRISPVRASHAGREPPPGFSQTRFLKLVWFQLIAREAPALWEPPAEARSPGEDPEVWLSLLARWHDRAAEFVRARELVAPGDETAAPGGGP